MNNVHFCSSCGSKIPIDSVFCSKCGSKTELPELKMENNNQADLVPIIDKLDSPPSGSEIKQTIVYSRANPIKRVVSYFVDLFIALLPLLTSFVIMVIFNIKTQTINLICLLVGGTALLYYIRCRDGFNNGQSYGKKLVGLMVVELDTNKPCSSKKKSQERFEMYSIFGVIAALTALTRDDGRHRGDIRANTQVIEVKDYQRNFRQ